MLEEQFKINSVTSIKINSGRAIENFWVGDISPRSFILGRAFHHLRKPPFSWFAHVIARVRAITRALVATFL